MKNKLHLILLTIAPLCGCNCGLGEYTYDKADQYVEYKEPVTIDNNDLSSLVIHWVSGNVSVVQKDEPLSFSEKTTRGNYLPLYYRQFNTGVEIEYIKSGTKNSAYNNMSKDLVVVVPLTYTDIYINTVSANSDLSLQNLNELDVNTVSGGCKAEINQVKTASLDTVSGNVDLTIADVSILGSIHIDSVSGDGHLYLDPSRGYQLNFDTISGTAKKNFEKTDSYPYNIFFDSVSGNLTIDEKQ